ncbi:MAG: hypothetical protein GX790_07135 [Syntrophomonadaceae bacterium]|nr:hypothetical protein [Syntrophomonadaceae bacterium]
MARKPRVESATGYYHVMLRGNNREKIFKQVSEKEYFLTQLKNQIPIKNISVTAYCLMDNHAHLLIRTDLNTMRDTFKSINIKFAGWYNNKFERIGHVFQDRYKSEVISSDEQLLHVIRYIHNNPVKANLVSKASDYIWSSYNSFISGKSAIISPLEIETIISMFSNSLEEFEKFHLDEDIYEFLEIREDLEQQREEKAQRIINQYFKQYEVKEVSDLNKEVIEQLIIDLLQNSHLSHRRIAELTNMSRGTVHMLSKKVIN